MTTFREKRRARRVASDEAHAWARSLHLGNASAKDVLKTLSLYVDGEGKCFVGLDQLAADTDLSVDTVRRRMVWLDEIGAISRQPQWFDGRQRNDEGRGKRTSDLITLLLEADVDAIEARAAGRVVESEAIPTPISPSSVQGLNSDQGSLSPRSALAMLQGPDSLNHEPESPPKVPLRGIEDENSDDGLAEPLAEPEHFAEFWRGYPGHEVMSRFRALEVFVTMTEAERAHARAAVPDLTAALAKLRRRARDAHKWLAEKGWLEFPRAKIASAPQPTQRRMIQEGELTVVQLALRMAGLRELSTTAVGGGDRKGRDAGYWSRPIGPDLLAMAPFWRDDRSQWLFVEEGSPRFAAWRDRLKHWLGSDPETQRKWLEERNPAIHDLPGSDPNYKPRKFARGLYVPRPFPPRVDGSWADDSGEAA